MVIRRRAPRGRTVGAPLELPGPEVDARDWRRPPVGLD